MIRSEGRFVYRDDELRRVIQQRLGWNGGRPAIVDGVVILRVLADLGLEPDYSIRVVRKEVPRTSSEFDRYRRTYPDETVNLVDL